MSLREKKKDRIRRNICEQAKRIFDQKGYEDTSMTDIAIASDIAVGTIYNYFASKPEVYLEVMASSAASEGDDLFLKETLEIDNISDLVMAYVMKYVDPYMKMNPDIMMSIMKAMVNAGLKSPMMQGLIRLDSMILNKLIKAFEERKKLGKLVSSFDSALHAENIYSIIACEMLYSLIDNKRGLTDSYQRMEQKVRAYFAIKIN